MEMRLQKALAQAGVASRRRAEELIAEGRVEVNGEVVRELGSKVDPSRDLIRVDGRLLEAEQKVYLVLFKPVGVVTTLSDPQGRPTVGDLLQDAGARVFAVGRLDFDAEGALLATNDGELANKLMHPRYQVPRTYLAKVKGDPDAATLEKLRQGVRLEDGMARPEAVAVHTRAERNTWLQLTVAEGRPHLVKRLLAAVGHPVVRLFRPLYAGVGVEGLAPGRYRRLTDREVQSLREMAAGRRPAADAGRPLKLPPRQHRAAEVAAPSEAPRSRGPSRGPSGAPSRGASGARRTGAPAGSRGAGPRPPRRPRRG